MPGLIQQAQRPQANPQDVERIVVAAIKVIHDPKVAPQLLQMMKSAGDPASALAHATLTVMRQLYEKSKGMPPAAIVPAGKQVMQELAKLAAAAKLFNATPEVLQQAVKIIYQQLQAQQKQPQAPVAPAAQAPAAPAAQPAAPVAA